MKNIMFFLQIIDNLTDNILINRSSISTIMTFVIIYINDLSRFIWHFFDRQIIRQIFEKSINILSEIIMEDFDNR